MTPKEKAEFLFDLFEELNKNDPDALRVVLQQRRKKLKEEGRKQSISFMFEQVNKQMKKRRKATKGIYRGGVDK